MSFAASNATTRPLRARPSPRSTSGARMPATTWAFVTTSPRATTQPDPSIPSPQATPRIRTTLARAARTSGIAHDRRVRLLDARRGPDDRQERVDPTERVDDLAGLDRLGQLRDHERLLRRASQLVGSRRVEQRDADDPHRDEAGGDPEEEAAARVEHAQRRDQPERASGPAADRSRRATARAPRRPRAAPRVRSGIARAPSPSELRRDACAEDRAADEPEQREHARDEPAAQAGDRGEREHRDRDPVEPVHPSQYALASRAPACEAAAMIPRLTGA